MAVIAVNLFFMCHVISRNLVRCECSRGIGKDELARDDAQQMLAAALLAPTRARRHSPSVGLEVGGGAAADVPARPVLRRPRASARAVPRLAGLSAVTVTRLTSQWQGNGILGR